MSRTLPLSPVPSLLLSPILLAVVLATTSCSRVPSDAASPVTQAPALSKPLDPPRGNVPPANAPKSATDDAGAAHYDGYANVRFGMTAAEVAHAWEGPLNGMPKPGAGSQDGCYYLNPVGNRSPAYFALMIEHGKLVRYDISNDKDVAPGGGKVGMVAAEIQSLYPGRIEQQPHKYTDGKYLRIKDAASGHVLVFETDAAGKVTGWRVGMPPQVDYVEGCS
jgi:hypothetical protein